MSDTLRCAVGGEPIIGTYYPKDGKAYCERHYFERFGKLCVIGGEILKGKYWTNCWGETYCEEHARGLPTCFSCHRHICTRLTGGGVRYVDGRTVCNRCRASAIDDSASSRPVVREICRVLRVAGGIDLGNGSWINLILTDRHELARRSTSAYCREPHGQATYQWHTGGHGQSRDYQVRILYGLAREDFAAICAHELGHIHMYRHDFPKLPDLVAEGLCELFAFTWLMEQGTREANYRLRQMWESTDPIYGEGFRVAYRALNGRGLSAVMAHVRQAGGLPTPVTQGA